MDYVKVNAAFNRAFLDRRYAYSPIYIDPDDAILEEIARDLGVAQQRVTKIIGRVVSSTLQWGSRNPYTSHLVALREWEQERSIDPPPFTALLGCFAIAAEHMRGDDQFSANNFYQRLADVFNVDGAGTQELRSACSHTSVFWEALNKWLVANDYAFGQPTAHPLYERKPYVGYAISQSLVRDVDRRRFSLLFDIFRLTKDDNITSGEMTFFVEQWIAGPHGPTETLKKLSRHPGVKERIADAALHELSSYDPAKADTSSPANTATRLFWVLVERTFPRRQVTPYVALSRDRVSGRSVTSSGPYMIGSDLRFFPLGATGVSCLGSLGSINYSMLLLAPVELRDGSGERFVHSARSVVPLRKREGETFLREVQRVIPIVPHYILFHESTEPTVLEYLSAYAASGFEIERGAVGHFPPDGWLLIRNARIIRAPSGDALEEKKELQDLLIWTQGDALSLEGGIQLARNIWHAKEPPFVFVATDESAADLRLVDGEEALAACDVQHHDAGFLRQVSKPLDGCNLSIELVGRKGRRIASERVSFRSADFPRWLHEPYVLSYDLGCSTTQGLGLSATSTAPARWIRGHVIEGVDEPSLPKFCSALIKGITDFPSGAAEDVLDDIPVITTYQEAGIVESCVLRGYHLWMADSDNVSRTCRACGAFVLMRDIRPKRRRREGRSKVKLQPDVRHGAARPARQITSFTEGFDQQRCAPSLETTFDAICYSRSGSWKQLQQVAAGAFADHLEMFKYCRALIDLGHLDVALEDDLVRPSAWSVPPASLVTTEFGTAFVSGFRSSKLVDEIRDAMAKRGANLERMTQAGGPDCLRFDIGRATAEELRECLAGLKDSLGRCIHVAEKAALRLACSLSNVDQIADNLRPVHVDVGTYLQVFDVATGKWVDSRLSRPGAYRDRSRGSTYIFFDGDRAIRGPFELIKLLAARLAGRRLHSYDPHSRTFACVIGCEPPGLFRRALTSPTGLLPQVANGLVIYHGVMEDLGYTVLNKLYV